VSFLVATGSFAAENEPIAASLSLQFTGLRWALSDTKYSDEADKREITTLTSGDLVDSLIWATINKVNIYFYPFQDSNALLSIGYMVRDDLEIGLDLGVNTSKVKNPKSELSSDLLGIFSTWIVPVGDYALENVGIFDVTSAKSTEINGTTGEEDSVKVTGTFFKLSSSIVIPIAKNAWYMGGLWWASENGKNMSADTTKKSTQFGVNVAGLRMTIE
jgi:hypothetical protein